MDQSLKEISEKHKCSFNMSEGTWDLSIDIRNLPTKEFVITKETELFRLHAICDYHFGTSTKPSYWSGNTADKYTIHISIKFFNSNIAPNFTITEYELFGKLFTGQKVKFKCADSKFKLKLKKDSILNGIFNKAQETAEFSPIITGKRRKDHYSIDIHYQSFEKLPEMFDGLLEFCLKFP